MSRGRKPGLTSVAVLLATMVSGCGGIAVSGRRVFAEHCEICHSLAATASPAQQGGDLRGLHLPHDELVQFTVEMPVIDHRLSSAEVRAVVDYVRALAWRR